MKILALNNKVILQGTLLITLLIMMLIFCADIAFANSFRSETKLRQTLNISKAGINRITMLPHRIMQVTGDESKYKLKIDEDGSNVYIMPLVKVGEKIELSMKTSTNYTEDLELVVSNKAGRTFHLKRVGSDENTSSVNLLEVKEMLRLMQEGSVGKYFVKDTNRIFKLRNGLGARQIKSYRYGDLIGAVLEVKNHTRKDIKLDETDFANLFKNSRAVSFQRAYSFLPPRADMQVFIVTGSKNEGQ